MNCAVKNVNLWMICGYFSLFVAWGRRKGGSSYERTAIPERHHCRESYL